MPASSDKYTKVAQQVYEELKKLYPVDSIVYDAALSKKGDYFDFAIIDEKTKIILMVIEVKYSNSSKNTAGKMAFTVLLRKVSQIGYPVKAIAAVAAYDSTSIEFLDLTAAINQNSFDLRVENYSLPSYSLLTTGTAQKALEYEKAKQKKKIDILKWICWIIFPVFCVGYFILDYFGWYEITTVRLILLGALGAFILIPCFQEIKIGEVSLTRALSKAKDSSK